MRPFQELDEYLSKDYSIDYWSDEGVLYAHQLIETFTSADWDDLDIAWRNRPQQWQSYCAQILPWGDKDRAMHLLFEMVQMSDDELLISAADSLREFDATQLSPHVTPQIKERLIQAANRHPGITAKVIDQLLMSIL